MARRRRVPGFVWVWIHRAQNRWYDLLADVWGFCADNPYSPIPGETAAYAHWRCGKQLHHRGPHRFNNYVWDEAGRVDFQPVAAGQPEPHLPWRHNATLTRRQLRLRDRWFAEQTAGGAA